MGDIEHRVRQRIVEQNEEQEQSAKTAAERALAREAIYEKNTQLHNQAMQLGQEVVSMLVEAGVPSIPLYDKKVARSEIRPESTHMGIVNLTRSTHTYFEVGSAWKLYIHEHSTPGETINANPMGITSEGLLTDKFTVLGASHLVKTRGFNPSTAPNKAMVDYALIDPQRALRIFEGSDHMSSFFETGVASLLRTGKPAKIRTQESDT